MRNEVVSLWTDAHAFSQINSTSCTHKLSFLYTIRTFELCNGILDKTNCDPHYTFVQISSESIIILIVVDIFVGHA